MSGSRPFSNISPISSDSDSVPVKSAGYHLNVSKSPRAPTLNLFPMNEIAHDRQSLNLGLNPQLTPIRQNIILIPYIRPAQMLNRRDRTASNRKIPLASLFVHTHGPHTFTPTTALQLILNSDHCHVKTPPQIVTRAHFRVTVIQAKARQFVHISHHVLLAYARDDVARQLRLPPLLFKHAPSKRVYAVSV